ncbi:MAG: aminotransferase class III-fold pyridoxal phosphate-dependent enzyme, partial [Candidatus Nealsonbacteria bacterium]|nr:aminotransferase class III-fold pyridoxal phosphate-dependent enzyme [Candidatus Nealsonbacteria bacterium]
GDDKSLEALFRSRSNIETGKPDLCAFIVEAIHGTRLIFPPKGYLKRVRELCDIYDVLLIIDEIYTGFGRTGHWFAFESEEIVPDIVCYSKTFGGGKATIAGYTARKDVFLKAYGKAHDSMIHTSTFSGMTEECATAIEALNIIKDDHLVERARELGVYLEEQLIGLKKRYPNGIADVRGCGLLWGVELRPPLSQLNQMIGKILPNHSLPLPELIGAIVLSEMFHEHNVLAYLGFTRRNLVVFSPALIAGKSDLDHAINALDVVLSKGWMSLVHSFLARQVHL